MIPAEDPSWIEIVWGQFRKRTLAYASMWGVFGLFLIAVYAPLVFSGQPFVWRDAEGTSFPWFTTLFHRSAYENAIDLFFNALLFPGTLVALVVGVGWRRVGDRPRRERAARRRSMVLAGVGVWLAFLTWVFAFPTEGALPNYGALAERAEAAGEPIDALFAFFPFSHTDVDVLRDSDPPAAEHWKATAPTCSRAWCSAPGCRSPWASSRSPCT